jgi:PadR family transcriptional regulator PadR
MILRVLCDGDSYGYEISKRITKLSGGCYSIKETTLYSAFSRLEKLGCVNPYPGTYSGGRERTYYALTESGKSLYRQKCEEWELTQKLIINFTNRFDLPDYDCQNYEKTARGREIHKYKEEEETNGND